MRSVAGTVLALGLASLGCKATAPRRIFFDLRDFGAVGDGRTKNTEAIRVTIAAAGAASR
jgi:polygalacturonase